MTKRLRPGHEPLVALSLLSVVGGRGTASLPRDDRVKPPGLRSDIGN